MFRLLGIGLAALVAADLALAQTPEDQAACQDDAFRLCPHTIPDRERTFQCMLANKEAVSPACRAVMARLLSSDGSKKSFAQRGKKGTASHPNPTTR